MLKSDMRKWLDVLASGDMSAWHGKVADDVVMRFPFAPAGLPTEVQGFDVCQQTVSAFWQSMDVFEWHDVRLEPLRDDPEAIFGTARSEATTVWGASYKNEYCFLARFRDGLILEYTEYFNPLPSIEVFGAYLAGEKT